MKKVLSTILAAIVAVSFSGLVFAQDQAPASATGPTEPTEMKQDVTKHHKRHHRKHHKRHHRKHMEQMKKEEAAPAPAPAAPAPPEAPVAK